VSKEIIVSNTMPSALVLSTGVSTSDFVTVEDGFEQDAQDLSNKMGRRYKYRPQCKSHVSLEIWWWL
jgi:hypothetical protein